MTGPSRREVVGGIAATLAWLGCTPPARRVAASVAAPGAAPAVTHATRVILLGTGGGPRLVAHGRSKSATAVIAGGQVYIVDCGAGVAQQYVAAGLALTALRGILITHHHSDHELDYGNLIYQAWASGLRTHIDTYGPPPLAAMTAAYWTLNQSDIETRIADEHRPDPRALVTAHEFTEGGVVVDADGVRITSARVIHPPIEQAYAYRFDTRDRSIVISGDTQYAPALVELAKGADVLVHEVMDVAAVERMVARVPNAATLRASIINHHATSEDVGRVASEAGVKLLVLTHLVPPDDPTITDEMWLAGVRKHYQGPAIVGRDLLEV